MDEMKASLISHRDSDSTATIPSPQDGALFGCSPEQLIFQPSVEQNIFEDTSATVPTTAGLQTSENCDSGLFKWNSQVNFLGARPPLPEFSPGFESTFSIPQAFHINSNQPSGSYIIPGNVVMDPAPLPTSLSSPPVGGIRSQGQDAPLTLSSSLESKAFTFAESDVLTTTAMYSDLMIVDSDIKFDYTNHLNVESSSQSNQWHPYSTHGDASHGAHDHELSSLSNDNPVSSLAPGEVIAPSKEISRNYQGKILELTNALEESRKKTKGLSEENSQLRNEFGSLKKKYNDAKNTSLEIQQARKMHKKLAEEREKELKACKAEKEVLISGRKEQSKLINKLTQSIRKLEDENATMRRLGNNVAEQDYQNLVAQCQEELGRYRQQDEERSKALKALLQDNELLQNRLNTLEFQKAVLQTHGSAPPRTKEERIQTWQAESSHRNLCDFVEDLVNIGLENQDKKLLKLLKQAKTGRQHFEEHLQKQLKSKRPEQSVGVDAHGVNFNNNGIPFIDVPKRSTVNTTRANITASYDQERSGSQGEGELIPS